MKIVAWNIDWDIEEEDIEETFGSLTDKNGQPYTAKDFGLPTWDEKVELEIDDDDWDEFSDTGDEDNLICDQLSDKYGWLINSFRWEVAK